MKYRPRRTLPAVVVAILVLAMCVLVALSAIQLLLGQRSLIPVDRLVSAGYRLHWHDAGVIGSGVVVATLGLLLVAAAVLPGAPIVLPLDDHPGAGEQVAAGVTRRSLRQTLLHSAETTDGVTSVAVGGPGDLVLLEGDPAPPGLRGTAEQAAHLRAMRPLATFVGGRLTHG